MFCRDLLFLLFHQCFYSGLEILYDSMFYCLFTVIYSGSLELFWVCSFLFVYGSAVLSQIVVSCGMYFYV